MPTYVYACDNCGAQFEQFQRFSDAPLTQCPRCEAGVRRVFQPVGIVFKGSGWYATDSRSTASNGSKPSTTPSKPEESPKTETVTSSESQSTGSESAKAA